MLNRRTIAERVNRNHRMLRELRRQLFELLSASPDGIRLTDIPPRYEMLFGRKLEARTYGCLKLLNVLQAVSDLVFIEQKDEGHWIASLTEQAESVIAQLDKEDVCAVAVFERQLPLCLREVVTMLLSTFAGG